MGLGHESCGDVIHVVFYTYIIYIVWKKRILYMWSSNQLAKAPTQRILTWSTRSSLLFWLRHTNLVILVKCRHEAPQIMWSGLGEARWHLTSYTNAKSHGWAQPKFFPFLTIPSFRKYIKQHHLPGLSESDPDSVTLQIHWNLMRLGEMWGVIIHQCQHLITCWWVWAKDAQVAMRDIGSVT